VRKAGQGKRGNRCPGCRDERKLQQRLRLALPLLVHPKLQVASGPQGTYPPGAIRELFAHYPALRELCKMDFEQLLLATLRSRLQAGECVEHVARDCGLSLFKIRVLLKAHPDLQRLAQQNRFNQGVERLGVVFQLVERENLSLWKACRHLGLACNRSTYAFARTTVAQERYPRLKQFFSQDSAENSADRGR
jgi:hypothetical protein